VDTALAALVSPGDTLAVRVTPKARGGERIVVEDTPEGPRARVWVSAPPEDGKANAAVCPTRRESARRAQIRRQRRARRHIAREAAAHRALTGGFLSKERPAPQCEFDSDQSRKVPMAYHQRRGSAGDYRPTTLRKGPADPPRSKHLLLGG